jgi:alpha-L-rhamnosidase
MVSRPSKLRVEHLGDGILGVGVAFPRLSWQLPDDAVEQKAYVVEIDGEACGRVDSDCCVLVPWPGSALTSRRRFTWRVKVWTEAGESEWSTPSWFETGLLHASDWVAQWIEPCEPLGARGPDRPTQVLRHRFALSRPLGQARLYATAHGIYEGFLNGQRIGDLELTPGFTSYGMRLQVQTYDVGDLLVVGENTWEVVLSDGWYRGRIGIRHATDCYGETLAFLAQLHVGDSVVATGDDWWSATGSIQSADLMMGQVEDRRVQSENWAPASIVSHDLGRLSASPSPPTRRTQELRPFSVTRLNDDRQVVDLGQNINGWLRISDLGPAGTELQLVHGEVLDGDGDVTLDNLRAEDPVNGGFMPLGQIDRVTSGGDEGEVFEPRHTTHGFRYVRIEGHPRDLAVDDLRGVVVHTDLRRTGWFRCSDDRLNRFHEIADWTFRDNACDIPTDCPQRERAGWAGDYQVFVPSAAFLYDVAGFSLKWLRDVAAEQLPDGCITNIAPDPHRRRALAGETPYWRYLQGSSGWGDAIVIVPWELHRAYGDSAVLSELWPAMVRWIDYAANAAKTLRFPGRAEERPVPLPHEQFLWDGGFHFGEWCEPESDTSWWSIDQGHVGTAFLHHSASLVARIGRLLGYDDDAERFDVLAARALDAWRTEYLAEDGSLAPDTQANHVRALAFGLVPETLRERVASRLVQLIREAGTHLSTGFLATPYLLQVLADTGHLDLAYEVLLQDTPPSWLPMVARGATTVWEDWNGVDEDGRATASLNHYSKGAVVEFLHTVIAGIQPLDEHPGYRRFLVRPQPGGGLTWAEAVHDCPYGRIVSSWRLESEVFQMEVTVPPGTSAEVVLPDGTRRVQKPGTATHRCALGPTARRTRG